VAAGPFAVANEDRAEARARAAECTAMYLTMMGEIYPRVVAGQGLAAEVDLVRATGGVPDEAEALLAEFTAYGTASDVAEQLRAWDKAVDITTVGIPPGLPWPTIEATIRAAAP
jgi:hypothetical protein